MSSSSSGPRIHCDSCGKKYRWNEKVAGRKVKCQCGAVMHVPAEAPTGDGADVMVKSRGVERPAMPSEKAANPVPPEDQYELDLGDPAPKAPAAPPAPSNQPSEAGGPAHAAHAAAPQESASSSAGAAQTACPSCGQQVRAGAVLCVGCGYNIKQGAKLDTTVGKAVQQGAGPAIGDGSLVYDSPVDGFFGKLSRSWEFAKISYGIIWDFKGLLIFPILSFISSVLVFASFFVPLLMNEDFLAQINAVLEAEGGDAEINPMAYVVAALFYFVNYFVIVFFNTALTACAMKVVNGEPPTIGYGFSIAIKRLPQIIGWALVSAAIGLILKVIENTSEKFGTIVAALLGTAWTVLTYFVVPVLVVEGVGPVAAVKSSVKTLKGSWGEAALGNFSMGLLAFLVMLPVVAIIAVLGFLAASAQNMVLLGVVVAVGLVVLSIAAAANSAADMVFKAVLYNFSTGRAVPAGLDQDVLASAFGRKK